MTRSRLFSLVLALLVCSAVALPAQSQTDVWKRTMGQQLATHLSSDDVDRQNQAMQLAIILAIREGRSVNLTAIADPLLTIYKTAPMPNRRMMAVSALRAVDHRDANLRLLQLGTNETDPRVQRAILYAVASSRWTPTEALAQSFNALRTHTVQLLTDAQAAASLLSPDASSDPQR